MITYNDLAELYEAMGMQGAASVRWSAEREKREDADLLLSDLVDAEEMVTGIMALAVAIPDPPTDGKGHDVTCWQRHIRCFAEKIRSMET